MTSTTAIMPTFTQREIVSIVLGLVLAIFLSGLDQTIIATSLSTMARDLNGWATMSWVVSAYLVASTVTTPIYGRLSDIFGRRKILLISIGLFVGASVLCALSQTMLQLIVARTLQGVGGGGLRSVSQAAVADIISPRERGKYQGYFATVMAVANVAGPVLGGVFAKDLSWHWIFWINIPLGFLAMFLCDRNLRRLPLPRRRPRIDWIGAVLIIAAATPLLLGMSRVEAAGSWLRADVLIPIVVGLVFMAILLAWERTTRDAMIPLRLFGNSIFSVCSLITFTMSMVMIGLIILVPLAFELVGGLSPDDAGVRLIPMTGGTVMGAFFTGQLITRTGSYRIFPIIGAGTMTVMCIALAWFGLGHSLVLDTLLTLLLGISFGFQLPSMVVPAQNALDFADTGIGLATIMFFRLIGGAFGVALLTAVLMAELNVTALATPGHEALGPEPGLALLHLELAGTAPAALLAQLGGAMRTAFAHVFLYAGIIAGITFAGALFLKEVPLRGGAAPATSPPVEPNPVAAASDARSATASRPG